MKKFIIILLTLHVSLFTLHAVAQSCLPEGITFTTQAQIDSFQIMYPGCTEIEGDVEINGDNITNLNGLSVLTGIDGYLRLLSNNVLTNLNGLENLISIGGNFEVGWYFVWWGNEYCFDNPNLTTLMGLNNCNHSACYILTGI